MAWANFAHLTKLDTDGISIKGTGKGEQSPASSGERLNPLGAESKAGGPAAKPSADVTKFLETQQRAVRRHKFNPDLRTRPWFNQAAKETEGKPDAFVAKAVEQLARGVNEQSIIEAQDVLNEVSRTPEGTIAVQKQATKANVLRLITMSKGRT
jgi:hypothetical protein